MSSEKIKLKKKKKEIPFLETPLFLDSLVFGDMPTNKLIIVSDSHCQRVLISQQEIDGTFKLGYFKKNLFAKGLILKR